MVRWNALMFLGVSLLFVALILVLVVKDVLAQVGPDPRVQSPTWAYALLVLGAAIAYSRALSARRDYWNLAEKSPPPR